MEVYGGWLVGWLLEFYFRSNHWKTFPHTKLKNHIVDSLVEVSGSIMSEQNQKKKKSRPGQIKTWAYPMGSRNLVPIGLHLALIILFFNDRPHDRHSFGTFHRRPPLVVVLVSTCTKVTHLHPCVSVPSAADSVLRAVLGGENEKLHRVTKLIFYFEVE